MRGRSRHANPGDMASSFARQSATVADWRGSRASWVLALVTTFAAACGGGGSKKVAVPTTTAGSTTTTVDPKQQVIAAYENHIQQYGRVSDDPNGRPDDPILASTMTSRFAQQIQLNLLGLRTLHRFTKGDVVIHAQQVDMQGTTGDLLACVRDDSDQYDQNGHDVSAKPGVGTPMEVKAILLQSADGRWLVDQNSPTGKPCTL